jgi:O-antigen ligase
MVARPIPSSTAPSTPTTAERLAGTLSPLTTAGLVVLIVATPWPLGAVRPAAVWLLVLTSWILLGVRGLALLVSSRVGVALPPSVGAAALLLLGVLSWSFVQALAAVPGNWAHPIWAVLADGSTPPFAAVSLDPDRTLEGTARLSAWLAIGILAYLAARSPRRASRLLWIFLGTALLQAVLGLVREAARIDELFGVPLGLGRASGSFVNPNHFAAYVNIALVATTVLLLDAVRSRADAPNARVAFARAVRLLLETHAPLTVVWAVLAMASLASGSRGGFLSLVLAIAAVALIRLGRGKLLAVLLGTLVGLGGILLLTAGLPTLDRLDALFPASELEPGAGGRIAVAQLALAAWLERPWLGHGLGTWPALFHTVRDERFPTVIFDYVHNSWVELLVELGAPAFGALVLALLLVASLCLRAARHASDPLPAIGFGAAVLSASHSFVDFAAQIPAVATALALVLGLAAGRAAELDRRFGGAVAPGARTVEHDSPG